MKQILLLTSAVAVSLLGDGAASLPASGAEGAAASARRLLPPPAVAAAEQQQHRLQPDDDGDETYNAIMAMQNETIPFKCYIAVAYLVIWCDITVPPDYNVTAEIKDGTCDEFKDPAESAYFREGIASPVFRPEVTDAEKSMGTFTHSYCARMDIMYLPLELGGYDEESLFERRFPMEITYNFREKVDPDSGKVKEELSSATLSDEGTKAEERNEELKIGVGVLAGALVTIALVAIIYGGRKRATWRRWQQREAERSQEEGENVEIMPVIASSSEENDIL